MPFRRMSLDDGMAEAARKAEADVQRAANLQAQQEKGAHIQKLTDQNDLLTVRVKDLEEEEVLMHKKFNRAREEIATHVKEKESLKQQLELAQEQIKQFTEGNTFVGKDKEILEIQAQNEFMTKLVDRLGKDRECVRCGTVYCPRDRARGSLEEGVDEESYAKEECAYHPIKQIRYGGCREVGCGEDAYYMCCGRCEKCSKGCRKGMHVS
mmetsp:Transcript_27579/g.52489  ORF Transcript_27579/g.52489 Transcript_27579/m.52489 type:complete len:210 (-) Transcript_27579:332-961(-)